MDWKPIADHESPLVARWRYLDEREAAERMKLLRREWMEAAKRAIASRLLPPPPGNGD